MAISKKLKWDKYRIAKIDAKSNMYSNLRIDSLARRAKKLLYFIAIGNCSSHFTQSVIMEEQIIFARKNNS